MSLSAYLVRIVFRFFKCFIRSVSKIKQPYLQSQVFIQFFYIKYKYKYRCDVYFLCSLNICQQDKSAYFDKKICTSLGLTGLPPVVRIALYRLALYSLSQRGRAISYLHSCGREEEDTSREPTSTYTRAFCSETTVVTSTYRYDVHFIY